MDAEGNLAKTYTLIYSFLKKQSHVKAAEAVKKAAKGIVILRDDIEHEGPDLDEIVKVWRTRIRKAPAADSSSDSEESSSDSESSSESSSSSSTSESKSSSSSSEDEDSSDSSDEEEAVESKFSEKTADRETSTTLSSAGDVKQKVLKGITKQQPKSNKEHNPESLATDTSESESTLSDLKSSSNSSSDEGTVSKTDTRYPAVSSSSSSSSESSSSSSESSSESDDDTPKDTRKKKPSANASNASLAVQKLSQSDDTQAIKKRKTSESGAAVVTAVTAIENNDAPLPKKSNKPPRKTNERFQRVKPQAVAPELVVDNGYEAKAKTQNDYGERAHRDLIVTRGAGFRKEKNKKKRGSYRGGEITLQNNSIKFDY